MDIFNKVLDAEKRIRPYILKTPLIESKSLSLLVKGKVYLKLESEQYTGSFKARGSLNKILSLSDSEKKKGVLTASTGNHALGFARALEIANVKGEIYLPENASKAKLEALNNYSVKLHFHGQDTLTTELYARTKAKEQGKVWISPYNDEQIIAGQGTIGIEIMEQLNNFDNVFITIGGGGLISGIGTYLKNINPSIRIIGCQPENSPEMTLSLEAGKIVDFNEERETISDGSAGGIEKGSITFPICQSVVDKTVLVSEREIKIAMKHIAHKHHKIIEGAAGVAVASLLKKQKMLKGSTSVVVICGSNIDMNLFKDIL